MPRQYNPQQMVWKRLRMFRRARACRNVSQACREFGVNPKTYYKWRKRLEEAGGDPQALRDRSRQASAACTTGTIATTPAAPTAPSAGKPQPRCSLNIRSHSPKVLPMFDKPTRGPEARSSFRINGRDCR